VELPSEPVKILGHGYLCPQIARYCFENVVCFALKLEEVQDCLGFSSKADHPRMRVFPVTDKDDGHIIRSSIAEHTMLHANFTVLSSTEPELY